MSEINAVTFEVIRNRLVAISDEMRIALQAVSGSPTVTEASDFFTGIFLPEGSVVSMGFQVSFQAPVCGEVIRHINGKPQLKVKDGDIFIGNDPYIGALHQNDVQMIGPIYADGEIIAWAGVEAHETDVGGMDFASWCPKAKEVWQEGIRIPCVKLVDQGEMREDVLEMIVTASRLPDQLGPRYPRLYRDGECCAPPGHRTRVTLRCEGRDRGDEADDRFVGIALACAAA